ncbi:MAG: hypothetical protein IJ642_13850 [Oscillospiraceae bacterium]|nr:hypothetical protein [Oscillospiraceae bacterium]
MNTENLKENFQKAKRHIKNGDYNAAANQMRRIAEHLAMFYTEKYGLTNEVSKILNEKKVKTSFLAQTQALRKKVYFKEGGFKRDVLVFLELSMKVGNPGSHGNYDLSEIEDYKVRFLAYFYEAYIKSTFEKEYADKFNQTSRLVDVTKKFNGKTISIFSCISKLFASAYDNLDGKPVFCNIEEQRAWESFFVQVNADGWATLRANTESRLYLMADLDENHDNAPVKANSVNRQQWEMFKIYQTGDFYCIESQGNHKFLSCLGNREPDYPLYACCDRNKVDYWEKFEINIL